MSFQGFAREERFSDNQIRIDINSVIRNDLAEANRQGKYLSRNATLEGQWRSQYLNKLIEKHEKEKRNREKNFKLFMDNRAEIHKIVQYNNEVKYEDAGKDRHVRSIGSIIGEGLVNLAVDVGSVAIKKLAQDARADWDAKQADKKKSAKANATSVEDQLTTPEKRKEMTRLTELFKNHGAERVEAELNDPSSPFFGNNLINAEAVGHWSGFTKIQREEIRYSPEKVANSTLEWAIKQEIDINGTPVSLATVGGMNAATQSEFLDKLSVLHAKEFVPEDINPISRGVFSEQFQKLNHKWQHASLNTRIAKAQQAERSRVFGEMQVRFDKGGIEAAYNFAVTGVDKSGNRIPGSIPATQDHEAGIDKLFEMFESGALPASALRKAGHFSFSPNSSESLYDQLDKKKGGTPSKTALRFKKLLEAQTVNEARDLQNKQIEAKLGVARQLAEVPNLSQEQARHLFYSLQNRGKVYETAQGAGNKELTKLSLALSEQAGITPAPPVSTAKAQAKKIYPKPARKAHVTALVKDEKGNGVDFSIYTGPNAFNVGKTKENLDHILVSFIAKQIDGLGLPEGDPRIETEITRILNDPQNEATKALQESMKLKTTGADGNPLEGGPIVPNFNLPELQSNGLKAYNTQIASAIKEGRKVGLNEINFNGAENWARGISNAIENDNIDQQNALSLQNPIVLRIKERNPNMTVGRIYNAAVKYFNKKGMDLQTLPQSQYPTPEQVRQLNKQFGAHYSNASAPLQRVIERNHANGGHPLNSATVQSASGITYSTNVVVTGFKDYKDRDIKLSPQATVSWNAMIDAGMPFNSSDVHSVYRDEAEVKRLWSQGIDASATGAHNRGEAMDVHGAMGAWIKKHGHKFGWGPEDNSYGHGGHGGHFIFKGYNPPQQPQQLPPATVPMNIPGVKLGKPAHPAITDTIKWLSDRQKIEDAEQEATNRMIYAYDKDGNRIGNDM